MLRGEKALGGNVNRESFSPRKGRRCRRRMRLHLPRHYGAADHRGRKWVDVVHFLTCGEYSVLKDERSVVYAHFQSRGSPSPGPQNLIVRPWFTFLAANSSARRGAVPRVVR